MSRTQGPHGENPRVGAAFLLANHDQGLCEDGRRLRKLQSADAVFLGSGSAQGRTGRRVGSKFVGRIRRCSPASAAPRPSPSLSGLHTGTLRAIPNAPNLRCTQIEGLALQLPDQRPFLRPPPLPSTPAGRVVQLCSLHPSQDRPPLSGVGWLALSRLPFALQRLEVPV